MNKLNKNLIVLIALQVLYFLLSAINLFGLGVIKELLNIAIGIFLAYIFFKNYKTSLKKSDIIIGVIYTVLTTIKITLDILRIFV